MQVPISDRHTSQTPKAQGTHLPPSSQLEVLPLPFLDYYLWLTICLVIRTSFNSSLTTISDIHTFLQSSGSASHGAGGHKEAPAAKGVRPKLRAEKVSHSSTRFGGKALNTFLFFDLREVKAASDIGNNKRTRGKKMGREKVSSLPPLRLCAFSRDYEISDVK